MMPPYSPFCFMNRASFKLLVVLKRRYFLLVLGGSWEYVFHYFLETLRSVIWNRTSEHRIKISFFPSQDISLVPELNNSQVLKGLQ